jgi:hypothetical protein
VPQGVLPCVVQPANVMKDTKAPRAIIFVIVYSPKNSKIKLIEYTSPVLFLQKDYSL